jgi:hypothetical protein
MSFLLSLIFSLQQKLENKRAEQALPGGGGQGCGGGVWGGDPNNVCKCK